MGLDITAYSNLEYLGDTNLYTDDDDPYYQGVYRTLAYAGFERSTRGLPNHAKLTGQLIAEGWAKKTEKTESFNFRAGSYTGYNQSRRLLATFAQYEIGDNFRDYADEPFFELIWFADNEGTIGPEAAEDLYIDFTVYRDDWLKFIEADAFNYYTDWYDNWIKAFDLGRQHGMVVFG